MRLYIGLGVLVLIVAAVNLLQSPSQNIGGLYEISPSSNVKVVTCATYAIKHSFDFNINVCTGLKWHGFGWKLKQFLNHLTTEHNNTIVFLVDGKDTFVNHLQLNTNFLKRWKSLNADIVVGSEEACYGGEDCDMDMVKALYKQPSSRSAFVNSPLVGYVWALREAITAMIEFEGGGDWMDDQLAATQLVNGHTRTRIPLRVHHDTKQEIFASFVHLAKYVHGENIYRHRIWPLFGPQKYTCVSDGKVLPFGCIDVGVESVRRNTVTLKDGVQYSVSRASCDVLRDTPDNDLGHAPIIWHGNGPGRFVFKRMQRLRMACIRQG